MIKPKKEEANDDEYDPLNSKKNTGKESNFPDEDL
jgi:hypothetical protein